MDRQRKVIDELAAVLKAISHPERIAIILFISECPQVTARVKDIYETLKLSQSNASRHLGLMNNMISYIEYKKMEILIFQ